jgi:prepilin-type N-terminal cleavage/methylation domain-containing protein
MTHFPHFIRKRLSPRRRNGFSLIEMLIVIAIMSIMLTVGAIGIAGITGGKSVASAVATTEALFEEARIIAVSKGTTARVMVSVNDPGDAATYLRRIVVVYKEPNADGTSSTTWTLSSRGMTLPDQVYYSKTYSHKDQQAGSGDLEFFNLPEGKTVKKPFAGKYVYYEFNSEGICQTPGAGFIVGTGARGLNDESPRVTGSAKRDFGGFVVWRNGHTSILRGPDQMGFKDKDVTTF